MKTIFKTQFGSHLYGTNTSTSDTDFKGVYIESFKNIILKLDKEVINLSTKEDKRNGIRNKPEDIDVEYKEIRRFLNDCMSGQTYALDMIFDPPQFWDTSIGYTDEWKFIQHNHLKLLSKNVKPYIEYCRQQAGKYGLKGSRLGELLRVIDHLKMFDGIKPLYVALDPNFKLTEFVKLIELEHERPHGETPIKSTFLEVLGKKFQTTRHIKEILPSLEKMNEMYGQRAILAMKNEGVDWKAISHAFRCCYQLIELATTKNIVFPLKQAEELKHIKSGVIPYVDLQDKLHELMEKAIKAVETSNLSIEPDRQFWDNWVLTLYR